jgi:hypothetical protein
MREKGEGRKAKGERRKEKGERKNSVELFGVRGVDGDVAWTY